jgi:hypothetical protein
MRFLLLSLLMYFITAGLNLCICAFALHNLATPILIDIRTQISLGKLFLNSSTACRMEEDNARLSLLVRHIAPWKRDGRTVVVWE